MTPALIDSSHFIDGSIEKIGLEEDDQFNSISHDFERNQSTISSLLFLYLRICDCNIYNLTTLDYNNNTPNYNACNEHMLIVFESHKKTNNSYSIQLESFTKLLGLRLDLLQNQSLIFHVNNITIHCQSLNCIENSFNMLKLPIIDVIKVNETSTKDFNFYRYSNHSYDISVECCNVTYGEVTFKINISTHTASGNSTKCIDELFVIDIAVYTGSVLSLLGLISIFASAILIKDWFKKRMFTLQLSLVFTLILFEKTLLTVMQETVILLTAFYSSVMIQFFWMFLIAITQYLKYVKVFYVSKINIKKILIFGWLLPPIPPFLIAVLTKNPHDSVMLLVFVALPSLIVICSNLIIYILIIYHVTIRKCKDLNGRSLLIEGKIAFFLPFLLGIVWIFGYIKLCQSCCLLRSILVSIGRICISLQGFILFVFSVCFDNDTRSTVLSYFRCPR